MNSQQALLQEIFIAASTAVRGNEEPVALAAASCQASCSGKCAGIAAIDDVPASFYA